MDLDGNGHAVTRGDEQLGGDGDGLPGGGRLSKSTDRAGADSARGEADAVSLLAVDVDDEARVGSDTNVEGEVASDSDGDGVSVVSGGGGDGGEGASVASAPGGVAEGGGGPGGSGLRSGGVLHGDTGRNENGRGEGNSISGDTVAGAGVVEELDLAHGDGDVGASGPAVSVATNGGERERRTSR